MKRNDSDHEYEYDEYKVKVKITHFHGFFHGILKKKISFRKHSIIDESFFYCTAVYTSAGIGIPDCDSVF